MNSELFDQALLYFDNRISLEDLRLWIAAHLRELLSDPFSREADFVAELEDAIVESNEKGLSEVFVREALRRFISVVHIDIDIPKQKIIFGASNRSLGDFPQFPVLSRGDARSAVVSNLSVVVSKS